MKHINVWHVSMVFGTLFMIAFKFNASIEWYIALAVGCAIFGELAGCNAVHAQFFSIKCAICGETTITKANETFICATPERHKNDSIMMATLIADQISGIVPSNNIGDVWIDAKDVSLLQTRVRNFDISIGRNPK